MSLCKSCTTISPKRKQYLSSKAYLMDRLGGICARCSKTERLQFDCIEPRGKEHHGKSLYDRMRFYMQEFRRGNLQLLCTPCHQLKSKGDKADMSFKRTAELLAERESESREFQAHIEQWTKPKVPAKPQPTYESWADQCARIRRQLGLP